MDYIIYFSVIIVATILSLAKFKRLDKASRIFSILLILTVISETMAFLFAKYYRNNFPVYHVFAPIQLFLVGLYFNYSIYTFKRKNIGIYVGVAGIVFSIYNSLYLQPLNVFNSNFLLFEGLCTIFMCLYAFNQMFVSDDIDLLKYPHFWFTFLMLIFWSVTYVQWGIREYVQYKMIDMISMMTEILWIVNIFTYSGIAFVFLFYRKNIVQRE